MNLFDALEEAFKERRKGFFGSLEMATTILENAAELWEKKKIKKFHSQKVAILMRNNPQEIKELIEFKPVYASLSKEDGDPLLEE